MRTWALIAAVLALTGCGSPATHRGGSAFCGLALTANGFDPVAARGIGCGAALRATAAIEAGTRGDWECARAMHASYELQCRAGSAVVEVLERSPVAARARADGDVSLAGWSFRLRGRALLGRPAGGRWREVARAPWCVPAAPREVLVALRLRPLTPHGGCFGAR